MNNTIENIVDEIIAEIICPDYEGEELYRLVDAWNAMPQHVTSETIEILRKRQKEFAEQIIRECVNIADEYVRGNHGGIQGSPTAKSMIGIEIQKHFGVE